MKTFPAEPDKKFPPVPFPILSPHEAAEERGLPRDAGMLLGLSGGADSVCLFYLLLAEKEKTGARLFCVHVHHGIRGADADEDEAFCRALCERHGVPYLCRRVDVPALAKERGESEETVGRNERYRVFSEVMISEGLPLLLLAHHADDRAETVVWNILRGCGTAGLAGIPAVRPIDGGLIVRPLIRARKSEITACLTSLGAAWREDATNAEESYTRNRIRHTVMPALATVASDPVPVLLRLSESAKEDDDALREMAEDLVRDRAALPLGELKNAHRAVSGRAVRLLYENARRKTAPNRGERSLSRAQTEDVLSLARAGVPHSSLSLPDGIRARVEEDTLFFETPKKKNGPSLPDVLTVERETYDGKTPTDTDFCVKESAVSGIPFLRHRLPGDTIDLGTHRKSLHKRFGEKRIPPQMRDLLPLLCDGNGLLAVPDPTDKTVLFRIGARPDAGDTVLHITLTRKEETPL